MKPWTESRNNKYMKYHSKLTYQLSFWNVSRKVGYHAGGRWFIIPGIFPWANLIIFFDVSSWELFRHSLKCYPILIVPLYPPDIDSKHVFGIRDLWGQMLLIDQWIYFVNCSASLPSTDPEWVEGTFSLHKGYRFAQRSYWNACRDIFTCSCDGDFRREPCWKSPFWMGYVMSGIKWFLFLDENWMGHVKIGIT